jgi:hypothetical protein
MKPTSCKIFLASAITALGVTLTGCQQAPPTVVTAPAAAPAASPAPAAAPAPSTESSSTSRSVEVKTDSPNPDSPASVTVKKESTTEQHSQQ